jgi:patched 1 protein/patched 2 protein
MPASHQTFTPLEAGWGVDRFPCTRVGPVDCFREGVFDYPMSLKKVDDIIDQMMVHPNMTDCMNALQTDLAFTFEYVAGMDNMTAMGTAAYLAAPATGLIFAQGIQGFWTYGYRWRPSYKDLSDEEILDHYTKGKANAMDPDVNVVTCIQAGLGAAATGTRTTQPCCVNWSGIKIPSDAFLGAPTYADPADTNSAMTSLTGIRVAYNLDHDTNYALKTRLDRIAAEPLTNGDREHLLLDFEAKSIDVLSPKFDHAANTGYGAGEPLANAHIDFWNGRTILDAIEDSSVPPKVLMALIPLFLGIYVQLNFAKLGTDEGSLVYSRMFCFSTLVTIVCIAVTAATGVSSWMFKLGPANVISVPFVALGIGIDDAYVLMYTCCYVVKTENPEDRIAETLQVAGSAVLLTSTTNFFTLLVCLITPNYSLQTFSAHLAIAVFFNLLFLTSECLVFTSTSCDRTCGRGLMSTVISESAPTYAPSRRSRLSPSLR